MIRVGGAVVVSDIGERNIPFVYEAIDEALAETGSREIEAIILSHAHDDHVKNFALLLDVGQVQGQAGPSEPKRSLERDRREQGRHERDPPPPRPSQVRADGAGLPLRRSEVDDPQPVPRRVHEAPPGLEQLGGLRPRGERKAVPLHGRHRDGRRARGRLGVAAAGARLGGRAARHAPRLEVRLARLLPRCGQAEERRHLREPGARPSRPRSDSPAPKRRSGDLVHGLERHGDGDGAERERRRCVCAARENSAPWWLRGERRSRGACVDQSPCSTVLR